MFCLYIYPFNLLLLCVYVMCVWRQMCMPQSACEGQRTMFRSWFPFFQPGFWGLLKSSGINCTGFCCWGVSLPATTTTEFLKVFRLTFQKEYSKWRYHEPSQCPAWVLAPLNCGQTRSWPRGLGEDNTHFTLSRSSNQSPQIADKLEDLSHPSPCL